ncbi:MAG: SEC-C metal-binding domain-containing protein [Alphaproteobacteria bacterium]
MPLPADITVVMTSCNRHDLLARTLESFCAHETEGRVARILVGEDGDADPGEVCRRFGAEYFRTGERVGQIKLIDRLYSMVDTPYIFHLEDDWLFDRSGFMEKSRALLEADPKTLLVWLRAWNDTFEHPVGYAAPDRSWGQMAFDFCGFWHGFTFTPSLRRLSDYRLLPGGGFQHLPRTIFVKAYKPAAALRFEIEASIFYRNLGYRALILDEAGYVRHIGGERHVKHPADAANDLSGMRRNGPCPCGSGMKLKHCHGALA